MPQLFLSGLLLLIILQSASYAEGKGNGGRMSASRLRFCIPLDLHQGYGHDVGPL